jgi:pimeloyl-ACP methyl ester carboxylesterase
MGEQGMKAGSGAAGGAGGTQSPYRVVPFDKHGACTGPRTRDEVVAASAEATDVFVFSHGWNNDWDAANDRYRRFVAEYTQLREKTWPEPDRPYRPLAVGVFWPSTALVAPWERAPDIAAATGPREDGAVEDLLALGDVLPPPSAERAYLLADRQWLTPEEARELAELLVPALEAPADELGLAGTSVDDLLAVWSMIPRTDSIPGSSEVGGLVDDAPSGDAEPAAAGLLNRFDPRKIVRLMTALVMKDRAGLVGATGVADLLLRLNQSAPEARIHLVGHSYGGKVVLSALCAPPDPGPRVESVLLLQPAMSCYCFATAVPGTERPGGYTAALVRSREPIVTTFSKHDVPLTSFFHLGARRRKDLGEAVIAGVPPSRYAALGGFGPQGRDADTLVVQPSAPPALYGFAQSGKRIVAIQADSVIRGHGDVVSPATAWALLSQVRD